MTDSFFCQWGISSPTSHSLTLMFLLLVFCGQEGKARDLRSDCRIDERGKGGLWGSPSPAHPWAATAPHQTGQLRCDVWHRLRRTFNQSRDGSIKGFISGEDERRSRGVCQTKAHEGQPYRSDWALTRERFISAHFSWWHIAAILGSDEWTLNKKKGHLIIVHEHLKR